MSLALIRISIFLSAAHAAAACASIYFRAPPFTTWALTLVNVTVWLLVSRQRDVIVESRQIGSLNSQLVWTIWLVGALVISGILIMTVNPQNPKFAAATLLLSVSYLLAARSACRNAVVRGLASIRHEA